MKTIFTLVGLLVFSFWADAQLNWNKVFSPDEIGPGSTTTLTFTINNTSGSPERNVAFTDNLPAGVTIATVPNVNSSGCGGANASITAPAGGSSISLSSGGIAPNSSCIITVSVTSSAVGMHTNLTLDLTSDSGNFGTATDDLNVVTSKPGFTKSFAPNSINLGEKSVLTFTIDNTANASNALQLNFSDNLPTGLVVANPSNANHTGCDFETFANFGSQTLTAVPGSGVISFNTNQFSGAQAGSNCIITVDVEPANPGTFDNVTSALTVSGNSSGFATDVLTATVTPINIQKSFTNDPTPPGQTVILDFTLTSFSQQSASNISFTDDLTTALAGLTFTTENSNSCGGTLSGQGTTMVTYTGGSLGSGANCTISITCTVPGGATPGTYTNTTSTVTGDIGGSPVTGNQATDDLIVSPAPSLTKSFTNDPVTQGNTVDLEFTLTNTSTMHSLTSAGFTDELDVIITGASNLPAPGFCGGSSTISFQFFGGIPTITVANAELAASASCTFTVTLQLDASAPGGTYPNVTSNVTGTVNGQSVSGPPATDDLTVLAVPKLTKSFLSTPKPGETVDLEFKIEFSENAPTDATNISFTDDLTAMGLPGLIVSSGGTQNNICGTGSSLSVNGSNDVLTFSSGTLAPGGECTFTVTLQVPGNAAPGTYTNTTSNLTATVASTAVTGTAATADLLIAAIIFTKEFLTNPVLPGGTTMLEFTIEVDANSPTDATNIFFQDDLAAMLTGATFTAAPSNGSCGAGSVFVLQNGNTRLQMTGGSVAIGSSCTFQVEVNIPASAVNDTYINATSINLAFINSTPIFFSPAVDQLVVDNNLLDFSKEFTDDPVLPGSNVTLEFTIDNLDNTNAVSGITFTDDLDAVISGMVATGLPTAACGGTLSGNSTISLTGGSLAPGASCTFTVNVSVPNSASAGAHTNETSIVTGTINGLGVEGPKATDDLIISSVNFTKAFGGEVKPGCTTTLDFTITNFDAVNALSNLSFNDDLDAVLSGLEAVLPAISNTCGGTLSGTGNLLFNGGSLAASSSCTISVTVQVPCTASTGIYVNTTSELAENSFPFTGVVAQANLVVSGTNTAPTITCPDNTTVECDESSASSATGIATATDDCTATEDINITESDAITAGTCPQESVITRTWTATDECGNSNSCDQTISIVDTEAPTITCPDDVTIECDESSASSATGVATATDNCADTEDITISESDATAAGTCPQESVITRTWTATDECGNSNSCDQTITIEDTEAPTITCPDDVTVECDESSASSATGVATATDNCADTEDITISESDATAAGSCPQESVITRTWTATDECGNSNSCDQTITIEDSEAPTITCPDDVTVECNESSASSATGVATATDNCADTEDITISESDATAAGTCPQESVITRTWTATDECGNSNSCDQTITIDDSEAPTITCPDDVTVECDESSASSATGVATATDNCADTEDITISESDATAAGSCPQESVITRTWTATDECGNSNSCDQTITIDDSEAPTITCPDDVTVECDESSASSDTGTATASDNCADTEDITISESDATAAGSCPQESVITRTWTATDECGNSNSCDQTITIEDTEAPTITCPDDVTIECDESSASSATGIATATDNCADTEDITISESDATVAGSCPQESVITRTWTATDECGNSNSCDQTITIVDTTAPTPVCQDLTVELDNNGNGSITPAEVGNGSNDNCSNVSLSLDNLVFTCDDLGENTVTLTTTDDCGNSDDCDATITVEDNIKPSLSCSNVPSPISTDEGECFATIAFPVPTVDDNCTVASLEAKIFDANTNAVIKNWTTNPDGEFDPGDYKIRWRVKDQSNNKRTCNKLFSVVDDELPDAKCKDVTLTLSGGSASITVADVDDGSTDNCGIDDIEVSPNTFDCSNVGANTVTLTVTDIYGNVNTCNPNITINGTAVTISDESHAEGTGAGFTFYFFKIERGDNNCTFTMTNATADGTATLADNDYVQASGTQYFIAGSSNVRYFITRVVKDSNVESDEDFLVNLSSSSSIPNFVNTPGIGTIINDDSGGSIWGGNDDEICDGIDNDGDGQIDENLYNEVFNGNIVLSNQQEVNQFQDCIREINGYLFITGKDITDVSALNNLTSVSKDMVIMNTGLSTLRGLDKLVQVKGILQIIDNHQLTSLIGLQNLKFIGNELNILENPVLNHCCPIQPLLRNGGVQNAVYVTGNDTECEHPNEIDAACSNVFDGTIQGNDCPDCPVTTKVRMDVFPNPASNELNVVVNQSDGKGKLKMVDALGRELISLDLVEGQLYYQFETSNFKRGVYMIYVQTGKEIQSKKVTLQ